MAYEKEMKMLERAEKETSPIDSISGIVPGGLSVDDALVICEGNIRRRLDQGERLVGYKVGLTNLAAREKMGMPDSFYGYLLESMMLDNGCELRMEALIEPKIESEICFRLGKDLEGKDLTVGDVLKATDGVSASFEICDARIRSWACRYPDFFADNGLACRVVLAGKWFPPEAVDFPAESVILSRDGVTIAEGRGELCMGHPARAVAWLTGKLAERGKGLKAGQIVMTGTLTPITPMEKDAVYQSRFSTLGSVKITTV
jgi:2-keto-4-pentenoate hydratase